MTSYVSSDVSSLCIWTTFVITYAQKFQFFIFQNGGRPASVFFKLEILTACRLWRINVHHHQFLTPVAKMFRAKTFHAASMDCVQAMRQETAKRRGSTIKGHDGRWEERLQEQVLCVKLDVKPLRNQSVATSHRDIRHLYSLEAVLCGTRRQRLRSVPPGRDVYCNAEWPLLISPRAAISDALSQLPGVGRRYVWQTDSRTYSRYRVQSPGASAACPLQRQVVVDTAAAPAREVEAVVRSPTNMAAGREVEWRHFDAILLKSIAAIFAAAMFVGEDLLANRRLQTLLLLWLDVRILENI